MEDATKRRDLLRECLFGETEDEEEEEPKGVCEDCLLALKADLQAILDAFELQTLHLELLSPQPTLDVAPQDEILRLRAEALEKESQLLNEEIDRQTRLFFKNLSFFENAHDTFRISLGLSLLISLDWICVCN